MPEFDPQLYALRPWYHDFSALGLDTTFLDVPLGVTERVRLAVGVIGSRVARALRGSRATPVAGEEVRTFRDVLRRAPSSHLVNQAVKDGRLMAYMGCALATVEHRPSCLDLFCADGYYSCRLKALRPDAEVTGVDRDPTHVLRAETVARKLGLSARFVRDDVLSFLERVPTAYDLVLCAGGLYHVPDPTRLLAAIKRVARGFAVLQSVVTLETEDPSYFVRPAKGWQHGCRFTHGWMRARLHDLGWRIIEEARAELPGNVRQHDRGSSFFLCG